MNRDTVIGFVLIALVLIGFSWYNQPSAEQIEAQRKEDSIAAVMKEKAEKKQKTEEAAKKAQAEAAAMGDSTALFFSALNGSSQQIVLKNGKVELSFDTKGGTIFRHCTGCHCSRQCSAIMQYFSCPGSSHYSRYRFPPQNNPPSSGHP